MSHKNGTTVRYKIKKTRYTFVSSAATAPSLCGPTQPYMVFWFNEMFVNRGCGAVDDVLVAPPRRSIVMSTLACCN